MTQALSGTGGRSDFPRYGDIYEVDLDPVVGAEIAKRRPALIVSNDENNEFSETVTVLPITGQRTGWEYPFEVLLPRGVGGLRLASRVKANQIRTIDKSRLKRHLGYLPAQHIAQAQRAIRIHLRLT